MKKVLILVMFLAICSSLCACKPYRRDVEGIENFSTIEGSVGINRHILPSDDFLEQFPYTSAQYNYQEIYRRRLAVICSTYSLVVVHYDADHYGNAKAFCLDTIDLVNTFEYNEYIFAENVAMAKARGELNEDNTILFPYRFHMFAYNDEKRCLVFVGVDNYDSKKMIGHIEENTKKDPDAWGEFWQEYFAEFYSLA